jgi:NADH:ubiquinone reductase (H+-translocating)
MTGEADKGPPADNGASGEPRDGGPGGAPGASPGAAPAGATTGVSVALAKAGPPSLLKRLAEAKHRVVVLGGGFAGVYTARYLTQMLGRRRDVHVELLSEENYFVFQPLLPEVAAGGVNPNHVVNPIRDIVPKAQFRWCRVIEVDTERKVVLVAQGEGRELVEVQYDHLVFGLGKVSDFSSMPGVSEHSLAMKDLGDAFKLRNHVFQCLELADVEDNADDKKALLTFVVAGGGFSGVETIGELSEMLHKCIPAFKNIALKDVRLVLVHGRDKLLPEMTPDLGDAALAILRARGIEVMLNARVRAATRHGVYIVESSSAGGAVGPSAAAKEPMIETRTFICTVGNGANPVVRDSIQRGGFQEASLSGRKLGVFAADLTLGCIDKPGYWAVGDCAGVPDPHGESLCAATAQFAIRQGKTCAHNILASIDGRPLKKFDFKALGMLASLGKRSAVADMMGFRFSGFLAWFAWRTVYLSKLPGTVRRLRVALDWTLDLFFPRDITQIQTMKANRMRVDHYEPGEIIISKHEVGRELFIVKSGDVEVYQPGEGGAPDISIARFGRGEVFGEKAILTEQPRLASVRAVTAVDVLVMSRDDFRAMVDQFPVLDQYFDKLLKERYPTELPADVPLLEGMARPISMPGQRRAG